MPFLWIALSFIAGIAAASELGGSIGWWLAGLGITFFIGVGILIEKRYPFIAKLGWIIPATKLPACLLPAFILLGGVVYLAVQPHSQPGDLFYYNDSDRTLSITTEVTEPPDYRTRSTLAVLKIINFSVDGTTYPGGEKVMSMMPANTPMEYGDRLTLYARPETPFEDEDFSYREYLATKQIFTILSYPRIETRTPASGFLPGLWLYRFRAHLIEITAKIFPAPESGLITGIILGPRNNISDDLYNAFRNSGTSHIIAISGFNIAILAALISAICLRAFGHWKGAITALIAIALYAMLVGGGASVVRASIMGGLAIMAQQIGRKQAGLNTLALTAFVMLLFNPMLLWDVGFQLSFFATLGLVWFASPFQEAFKNYAAHYIPEEHLQRVADWTGEYFLFTIAAQITTLPVLLYHFHQVPFALLIANPLVLPAQPPLMGFSAAAMAAGLIWLPLGRIVGLVAVPFTTYTIRIVEWAAGLNLPVYRAASIPLAFIFVYFALLAVIVYKPEWKLKVKNIIQPAVVFSGAILVTVLLWHIGLDAPDGKLHITLLGGKNARTVFIQTPTGRYMLINGGEDKNALVSAIDRRLPVHFRQLDALILAPGSSSDLLAMPGALTQLEAGNIMQVGALRSSKAATNLDYTIGMIGKTIQGMAVGDRLDLGDGAVLTAESADLDRKLLKIAWQGFSMLFGFGEVDAAALPPAGVVYLAEWDSVQFERFPPQLLVVDGMNTGNGVSTLSTLQHGWVTLTTDGSRMWVKAER